MVWREGGGERHGFQKPTHQTGHHMKPKQRDDTRHKIIFNLILFYNTVIWYFFYFSNQFFRYIFLKVKCLNG